MSQEIQSLNPPLTARRGGPVQTLGIARISNDNQDQLSLADQEALYRRWLDRHAPGEYELTMIAGRGSGELLERAEVDAAAAAVESERYDLVLCEDLGRVMRRVHAILFCELCEDIGKGLQFGHGGEAVGDGVGGVDDRAGHPRAISPRR